MCQTYCVIVHVYTRIDTPVTHGAKLWVPTHSDVTYDKTQFVDRGLLVLEGDQLAYDICFNAYTMLREVSSFNV